MVLGGETERAHPEEEEVSTEGLKQAPCTQARLGSFDTPGQSGERGTLQRADTWEHGAVAWAARLLR